MSIRLVFSDVDGTILPAFRTISDRTRAAIRALGEKGIPFVICSGRWFAGAMEVAESAGLGNSEGYIIIANGGAVVRLDGTPLKEWFLPEADARRAAEIIKKYPTAVHAYGRNSVHRLNSRLPGEKLRKVLDDHFQNRFGCTCITDDEAAFDGCLGAVYKIEAYIDTPGVLTALRPELEAAGLLVASSHPDNLEILAPGMGKGRAVRWLMEYMGVAREETMAFGDNTNDLPMLEAVEWPVVMGNGEKVAIDKARIVAPPNYEAGVGAVIEEMVL